MYKQSIQNIKAVIIPLDGTILDLNRLRYNYYNHLCKDKNISFSKQEFYDHLSNMYDMYKDLPLSKLMDVGPLNAKIERELLQYLQFKGLQIKEGIRELIEYLHQKNIQIAVISTHRTKDAVTYLQMAHLYHKVHFIIGSDTSSLPLPSTQMLETITDSFKVKNEETLVLSSFASLTRAANRLHMNVIYCEDLISANKEAIISSYKISSNLFEVLNILLFDQYEEVDMYSSILGMNENMSKEELTLAYENAKEKYFDDKQLLNLIEETYSYHLSKFKEMKIPEQTKDNKIISLKRKHFSFEDEVLNTEEDHNDIQDVKKDVIQIENNIIEEKEDEVDENHHHIRSLEHDEELELASLLKQINRKEVSFPIEEDIIDEKIEPILDEDIEEENQTHFIGSFIINFIYTLSVSFLIIFIGIIISVAFIHQFRDGNGIFGIISTLFQFYNYIIESIFRFILNLLHSFINIIPSYENYSIGILGISKDGMQLFNIYIFNCIIIILIKGIWIFLKRRNHDVQEY